MRPRQDRRSLLIEKDFGLSADFERPFGNAVAPLILALLSLAEDSVSFRFRRP